MPRFYLNLRRRPGQDGLTADIEGDEIPDPRLLHAHVLWVAGEVMRTRAQSVRDWLDCSFEVEDEDRQHVFTVPFSDSVGRPGPMGASGRRSTAASPTS